jgi:2-(1,2-epoxy-1,2-dihydrophenyl)acetyl-CoA isomerase
MSLTLRKQEPVATITLDRPEKRNASLPTMWDRFTEFLDDTEADPEVRAVVLTGAGGAFCSGADLSLTQRRTPDVAHRRLDLLHRQMSRFFNFSKPTIAAVDGATVRVGWSLALCCDLMIIGLPRMGDPGVMLIQGWPRRQLGSRDQDLWCGGSVAQG